MDDVTPKLLTCIIKGRVTDTNQSYFEQNGDDTSVDQYTIYDRGRRRSTITMYDDEEQSPDIPYES